MKFRQYATDWYYQQIDLGFNYRMTDIQAALGYSQLKRLNDYILKRIYIQRFAHLYCGKLNLPAK